MKTDRTHPERIVLQPTAPVDDDVIDLVASLAAAVDDDVVTWYTLDVTEYPGLDDSRAFSGERGEKALVVDRGNA
ncbi:hypothetical protein JZX76_11525 [Haloarcula hispanica]|uniref:Uncharacterized protein n=1 Tax=Haloarcula hispanica TaxID=51589 RepID=A0A482TDI3_HALHI|nr:hypothetical protein [Haloarcula hispanica]MCJ0620117.1 hypothetical protein [Haloarcula hispanica]RYJ10545.1 hypothetical protein ELS20_11440 [Haloarcula hispanica]